MRRLLALLALLVLCCLLPAATVPGLAQEATPATGAEAEVVLSPDTEVAGAGLAEWSARFYQWLLSFPEATSPLFDETGGRCAVGQHGPVFFLAPHLAAPHPDFALPCAVPAGVAVFVPHVAVSCSTVEGAPFFGRDEQELVACAAGQAEGLVEPGLAPVVEVDGVAVRLDGHRVQTPPFAVALPADNLLGAPRVVTAVVAEGYHALLAPLPPGRYMVRWGLAGEDGVIVNPTAYELTVAEPVVAEPGIGATPAA